MNTHLRRQLRRYLFAGLLVWLPIWLTLLIISFLIGIFDTTISLLPQTYRPETLIGFNVPGLGVVISLLIVFLTGMLVTNFLGRRLIIFGESIVAKIPLVRSIYSSSKQLFETIFSSTGKSFRKVFLIEFPRKGLWSIAFQTGDSPEEITNSVGEPLLMVFVPTTPNPTAGFLVMLSPKEAIELQMSVEQALKLVISLGTVQPAQSLSVNKLPTSYD